MTIQNKLAELREKSKDASERPWIYACNKGRSLIEDNRFGEIGILANNDNHEMVIGEKVYLSKKEFDKREENWKFIIAACNSYDTLLEIIGELSEALTDQICACEDRTDGKWCGGCTALTKAEELLGRIK